MQKIKLTCPFTGVEFTALKSSDGDFIAKNVITGENIRVGFNKPAKRYLINPNEFKHAETLSMTEAMKILDVSYTRISDIAKNGVIRSFTANRSTMFLKDDIIEYKKTRKPGRPKKER